MDFCTLSNFQKQIAKFNFKYQTGGLFLYKLFKPLGNRVVVEPLEGENNSGGIYIPDTAKEKTQEGKW